MPRNFYAEECNSRWFTIWDRVRTYIYRLNRNPVNSKSASAISQDPSAISASRFLFTSAECICDRRSLGCWEDCRSGAIYPRSPRRNRWSMSGPKARVIRSVIKNRDASPIEKPHRARGQVYQCILKTSRAVKEERSEVTTKKNSKKKTIDSVHNIRSFPLSPFGKIGLFALSLFLSLSVCIWCTQTHAVAWNMPRVVS